LRFHFKSICVVLAALSAACAPARALTYTATLLHPTGYAGSAATGASGTFQVGYGAGSGIPTGTGQDHALLWNGSAASMVDLNPAGFEYSEAVAVSGNLQAGSGKGPATSNQFHALIWNGTAQSYLDLNPTGFSHTQILGASGTYQAGLGAGPSTDGESHAMLWSGTAASKVDLHPAGYSSSAAWAASGESQVGYAHVATGMDHAMLWHGTANSAVDLNPLGFDESQGTGASDNAQVGRGYAPGYFGARALLWHGTSQSLVDLTPPDVSAQAFAVRSNTQVGDAYTADWGASHAVLWHGSAASMVDLHPYLDALPIDFTSSTAFGISDDGTIVGVANRYDAATEISSYYAVAWKPIVDFNQNGFVDAADYVAWRNGGASFAADDYNTWRAHFGQSSAASSTSIPEPTALALCFVAAFFAAPRRVR